MAADSCAGRPQFRLFAHLFSHLFFAFSISPPLLFLFGTNAYSPNSTLPRLFVPNWLSPQWARPLLGHLAFYVRQEIYPCYLLLLFRSGSPLRADCTCK